MFNQPFVRDHRTAKEAEAAMKKAHDMKTGYKPPSS
jgi:hypothetical protein